MRFFRPPNETDREVIKKLNLRHPYVWLATWFGLGFLNPAPGTWGSFGALPFGLLIFYAGGQNALAIAVLFIFIAGYWASALFEKDSGEHDSKMIVIDEVAGQWIALIPAALNPVLVILSFIFFRFFDIAKPWPVSWFDQKLKGPLSVMGDDIVAGLYAALCLIGLKYAGLS